jgi:large subunit ribosomal protein L6
MSRIGKQPIPIPSAVKIAIDGNKIDVTGPKGHLDREVNEDMRIVMEDGRLVVTRPSDEPRHRAMHGLTRALLANMVTGVDAGFRKLALEGQIPGVTKSSW